MALILLASVHPICSGMITHERDKCHAPLISNILPLVIDESNECNIAFEQYSKC